MMGWRVRVGAILVALSAIVVSPHEARAQASSADRAAAQALFDQGMQLMEQKKYAEACPKLEESNRLDPGTGTRFNLADCFSQIGKTATAWTLYLDVAAATKASGQLDREKVARDRARALEPKLAKLTILAPNAAKNPGIEVKRDNSVVSAPLWGTPLPIDQGEHALAATAPGMQSWSGSIVVTGDGASVTATVPELLPAQTPAVAPPPAGPGTAPGAPLAPAAAAVAPPPPRPDGTDAPTSNHGSSRRVAGIVVAGVGLVGLGLGVGMALSAKSKNDDAHSDPTKCASATTCYPAGYDEVNSAKTAATVSTIAFIAGGVGFAGGLALFLTAPKGAPARSLRMAPAVGRDAGGVRLSGQF